MIYGKDQFEVAAELFLKFQPVKIERHLKDLFHDFLSQKFIAMGVQGWSATMYPLITSWKFKRTNEHLKPKKYK